MPHSTLLVPNRREFLTVIGAVGAASLLGERWAAAAPGRISVGYASITWDGQDLAAIRDVSELGFPGIQLRSNILKEYGDKPAALTEILATHKLTMVALSSGALRIDQSFERDEIATHTRNARFVRDVGGLYLQVTDARPKRDLTPDDYTRLGRLLTELGKRTAGIGVPLGYHNHMHTLGERPEEVDWIMDAADPRYVKLELDVAHYHMGGGDPVKAIRAYKDRLLFLHIKDVETPVPGATGDLSRSYRFVELGRGKVDLKGIFRALDETGFQGWAVVELDRVPDNARTPKESAQIAHTYLEGLGVSVGAGRPTPEATQAVWVPLFDGKTLNGWRAYKQPDATATRWKIEDGMLTVDPAAGRDTRGALDLITTGTYDEFELAWEWKVAQGGNSGVKYLLLEDRESAIGHEYQIIDDERHADAKIGPHRQTAALYDVIPAADRPLKPAGEFNDSRIIVQGRRVEHWLNAKRVLVYELGSPELLGAVARSKFKGIDRFGTPQTGHILLQDHGDRVWYRNIRIRRIGSGGVR
ncbi:MAG TPA: family 16 glycoside hydrolase [Vicinamibacterales bacterium]|nr:family 16 glycoside hydrolase [Vicinamibacterales bacterium]